MIKYIILLFIFMIVNLTENYSLGDSSISLEVDKGSISSNENGNLIQEDIEDDFSPGLLFFVIFGAGLALAGIGAGIVLTIIGVLILFGLVSFGIISTSILVAINKKSFSKGFKTFVVLITSIGGIMIGPIVLYVFNLIVHWWPTKTVMLIGMPAGLVSGLGIGIISIYIINRLTIIIKQRLQLN